MSAAVTTRFEMDCAAHPTSANWKYCIAGFVCPLVHPKSLAAKRKHLGHKRHALELSVAVQGTENFFLAPHFDPIAHNWRPVSHDNSLISNAGRQLSSPQPENFRHSSPIRNCWNCQETHSLLISRQGRMSNSLPILDRALLMNRKQYCALGAGRVSPLTQGLSCLSVGLVWIPPNYIALPR